MIIFFLRDNPTGLILSVRQILVCFFERSNQVAMCSRFKSKISSNNDFTKVLIKSDDEKDIQLFYRYNQSLPYKVEGCNSEDIEKFMRYPLNEILV